MTAAFWVRTGEEGLWYLYISSDAIDPVKIGDAYGTVYASLYKLPDPWLSLSDLKLVPTANPIARAAIAIRDRYRGRIPLRFHGNHLGALSIEEAYIYPSMGSMSPTEILQTVAVLMNRSGSIQPSLVSLTDGNTFQAIPVGLNMQAPGKVRVVLHEIATDTDRETPVEEIASIR